MRDRLAYAMGDEFPTRLNERLAEPGLTDDVDARRVVGAQILSEIAREIKGDLMHKVLREHGLALIDAIAAPIMQSRLVATGRAIVQVE